MASRTTSGAVAGVLGGNHDGSTLLTPYMDSANPIVTRTAACATGKGITLSAIELELIERWLAAYFYTIMDPLYTSKNTADAGGSFNPRSYLEAAYAIDYSGCLKAIIERKTAGMMWLGKPPSEQLPYEQRD